MSQGSGGAATEELINSLFFKYFNNEYLLKADDSALVPGSGRIALTTDSFVVTPLVFPGGDIGRLAVCGTVNDLLMSGAQPKYLTAGFILEEGLDVGLLEKIVQSMADCAGEAGVKIVTGDTKVIEGHGGLIINTAGVGFVKEGVSYGPENCRSGDVIILTGALGDHHMTILSHRMNIENDAVSDTAPLVDIIQNLISHKTEIHAMRDVTRGGLGTVLNEFAERSGKQILIEEEVLPIHPGVSSFCNMLGLDPLYMGNEGKAVIAVGESDAKRTLEIIKKSRYGEEAAIIGRISEPDGIGGEVVMRTPIGGLRIVNKMYGEGLPRIC